jgi:hypothetical protein
VAPSFTNAPMCEKFALSEKIIQELLVGKSGFVIFKSKSMNQKQILKP